jgi:hypothetical protein
MIITIVKLDGEGICQEKIGPWVDAYNQPYADFRNNSQKVES